MLSVTGSNLAWSTLCDVIRANADLGNNNIVTLSLAHRKLFMLLKGRNNIISISPNLCLCEVVVDDTARPFLDFDGDVHDMLGDIESTLRIYFRREHNALVNVGWKYSGDAPSRRWHCVVSGVYFNKCWANMCKQLAEYVHSLYTTLPIDYAVYKANSSLRMPYQNKYENSKYTRRLYTHGSSLVDDLLITHTSKDLSIVATDVNVAGVCVDASVVANNSTRDATRYNTTRGMYYDMTSVRFELPYGLRPHKIVANDAKHNVIRLLRYAPSVCILCSRLHEHENAYLILRQDTIELKCYRRPVTATGVQISAVYAR